MSTVIVLVTHGMPPSDFPKRELAQFFELHARRSHAPRGERATLEGRYAVLETRMRARPRTSIGTATPVLAP